MIQLYATSRHQSGTKLLVLLKHSLICSAYQVLKILALTVYRHALPPNDLVCLPKRRRHILGFFPLHLADLHLSVDVLIFQRLKESLHTSTRHTIEAKIITAQVAQHIGWIGTFAPYIQRPTAPHLPFHIPFSQLLHALFCVYFQINRFDSSSIKAGRDDKERYDQIELKH
jgi:hypothetical protein